MSFRFALLTAPYQAIEQGENGQRIPTKFVLVHVGTPFPHHSCSSRVVTETWDSGHLAAALDNTRFEGGGGYGIAVGQALLLTQQILRVSTSARKFCLLATASNFAGSWVYVRCSMPRYRLATALEFLSSVCFIPCSLFFVRLSLIDKHPIFIFFLHFFGAHFFL